MANLFYIDGYHVIHHCRRLKALARADFEAARETLIDRVARYCSDAGQAARIIFDGCGRRPDLISPFLSTPRLEVIYSPAHQTADALIEREVYEAGNRSAIVVVTSDRGIRDLCGGLGALTMHPDHFLKTIEESLQQARTSLQAAQHRPQRATRMEDHLDEETRASLENLRQRLEDRTGH
ncbi:MAG TPA: NYN domain-containing protein [Candidatus Hydrogenedentes bacterium]|nr:NYN domain-containing protein [Candidatus Hydrogenedentota bacterium]